MKASGLNAASGINHTRAFGGVPVFFILSLSHYFALHLNKPVGCAYCVLLILVYAIIKQLVMYCNISVVLCRDHVTTFSQDPTASFCVHYGNKINTVAPSAKLEQYKSENKHCSLSSSLWTLALAHSHSLPQLAGHQLPLWLAVGPLQLHLSRNSDPKSLR